MEIIAKSKSKSLLNKTSPKPKKQNKSSEKSKSAKTEYKFELREKLLYLGGLYEEKNGLECTVVSRSQTRNGRQFYKVKFEDDGLTIETIMDVLKKVEVKEDDELIENTNK